MPYSINLPYFYTIYCLCKWDTEAQRTEVTWAYGINAASPRTNPLLPSLSCRRLVSSGWPVGLSDLCKEVSHCPTSTRSRFSSTWSCNISHCFSAIHIFMDFYLDSPTWWNKRPYRHIFSFCFFSSFDTGDVQWKVECMCKWTNTSMKGLVAQDHFLSIIHQQMRNKMGWSGGDFPVAEPASNFYMVLSDCLKAILNCLPWADH